LLLRAALLSLLRRWAVSPGGWNSLAQAIRLPSVLWSIVLGIWAGNEVARQSESLPERLSHQVGLVLELAVIFSVTITVSNVLTTLVQGASERRALGRPVTGLGQSVVVSGSSSAAAPPGAPAFRSRRSHRGVGGLAVAPALQDTPRISSQACISRGQADTRHDSAQRCRPVEGHVVDIGWRSTRVRMLQEHRGHDPEQARRGVDHHQLRHARVARGCRSVFPSTTARS
jgi:hypothetical protein